MVFEPSRPAIVAAFAAASTASAQEQDVNLKDAGVLHAVYSRVAPDAAPDTAASFDVELGDVVYVTVPAGVPNKVVGRQYVCRLHSEWTTNHKDGCKKVVRIHHEDHEYTRDNEARLFEHYYPQLRIPGATANTARTIPIKTNNFKYVVLYPGTIRLDELLVTTNDLLLRDSQTALPAENIFADERIRSLRRRNRKVTAHPPTIIPASVPRLKLEVKVSIKSP